MRKRSARIINRQERKSVITALLILLLLLAGCEAVATDPESVLETPASNPTTSAASIEPNQTSVPDDSDYVVERVALATNVNSDGSPIEELSVIPSNARNVFISVLISGVHDEMTFRAFWYEGTTIISQSEAMLSDSNSDSEWIALGYQIIENFNFALPHTVELRIDGRKFESYPFRVGIGELENIITFSTLALGTDPDGEPIGSSNEFDLFAGQLVTIAHISTAATSSTMQFNALLYRADTLIRQTIPDGGQPSIDIGAGSEDHQITFTFLVDNSLIPGDYSVSILINGAETAVLPFTILDGRVPTPTPVPTATPAPTPTSFVSGVSLVEAAIVDEIDDETGEPSASSLRSYRGDAGTDAELFAAVKLSDLRIDDVIEFDVILDGRFVHRQRFPIAAFEEGWLTVPLILTTPSNAGDIDPYEILFYVNGTRARTLTLSVSAS